MGSPIFVSVVVNNYNYAHFLRGAIESALQQTYEHKEIIVVDDGSTDDSRSVIASFGGEVTAVYKSNEGQASTFNSGFTRSRGDVIVFLDADDLLMPTALEACVPLFASRQTVKVHWPLIEIDSDGNDLGTIHRKSLIDGDFRNEYISRGPVSLAQSPTSGNAWARWFLDKVIPLPEHEDKHGADGFLKKLCPIYGVIRRVREPQGYYRIHSSNFGGNQGEMFKIIRGLKRYKAYCKLLSSHLEGMGIDVDETRWMGPDSQYAWLEGFVTGSREVAEHIPTGDAVILIDNENLGDDFLPNHDVVNLGSPVDSDQAISCLDNFRNRGFRWVVIGFPAFWWSDDYANFLEYLISTSHSVFENQRIRIFGLHESRQSAPN